MPLFVRLRSQSSRCQWSRKEEDPPVAVPTGAEYQQYFVHASMHPSHGHSPAAFAQIYSFAMAVNALLPRQPAFDDLSSVDVSGLSFVRVHLTIVLSSPLGKKAPWGWTTDSLPGCASSALEEGFAGTLVGEGDKNAMGETCDLHGKS